ncbi:MAG: tRNA pseudouridine(38-40) synthase TruA [Sulfurospirillaceae bacterium]|nr:tRNA pseudouridine(38-40) synthase TruA [Sulfurospirillaceae bacterium]MDD2826240.1 tRNA pseudouridine(38-40) synthase TruA [Sulfurospirillaceae bacterium]
MQRVKVKLSYDGSCFNGFQMQKNENSRIQTVAGTLNKALLKLNIITTIVGSGRTDTNVHALRQVVHFDVPSFWIERLNALQSALNDYLMPSIYIQNIELTPEFHARYDAQKRLYRYIMYDAPYVPYLANYALHVDFIDVDKLNLYAKTFEGKHHFGLFKKRDGGPTGDERTIFKAGAYRYHHYIVLYFLGDAFLRSQIRLMGGFLYKMMQGKLTEQDLLQQLDSGISISSTPLPACGLYLSRIYY